MTSELAEVVSDVVRFGISEEYVLCFFCPTLTSCVASLRSQEIKSVVAEFSVIENKKIEPLASLSLMFLQLIKH